MNKSLFVAVDGGASKSVVRVEDENGCILGHSVGAPANIRLSVNGAWEAILSQVTDILKQQHLSLNDPNISLHAGMGLAGTELTSAYDAFISYSHPFKTLLVVSDAHAACVAAHEGEEGAIVVVGTGVIGFQIEKGVAMRVGGYGFPHDDIGGGAWLGLEAVKHCLQCIDGRSMPTPLSEAIYDYFAKKGTDFIAWCNSANSTEFAKLAPLVIQHYSAGEKTATKLIIAAAEAVAAIILALNRRATQPLPCSLVGGIAPYLQGHVEVLLHQRLHSCRMQPEQGAMLLLKHHLQKEIA